MLIFLYRYTFYALLQDVCGKLVRNFYTDTDSFFFYFLMEDLEIKINARPYLRDAFDFSEISNNHFSNFGRGHADLHAEKVGYFKNKTMHNLIVEFIGLHPKM